MEVGLHQRWSDVLLEQKHNAHLRLCDVGGAELMNIRTQQQ